jgi:HSP20 family protein
VSITDDVITIKGRRELPFENSSDESIYLQECFWGNFSRSLILPVAVDLNHVEARFKNNVLTVRIPKTERVRTRVIRIEE